MFGLGVAIGLGNLAALDFEVPPLAAGTRLSLAAPSADVQCWFHEPRAIARIGKVWFGTNGSNDNTKSTGRATLYEVNEATGTVTSVDLATGSDWGDDHNYPVVVFRSDGRLVVFYCAHRIVAPIRYRISVNVGTIIGGWSQEYTIDVDATRPTYPSPFILSGESNKAYLLFRNGVDASLSYLTSTDLNSVTPATVDGGALGSTPTWSAEIKVTVGSGTQGIYTKARSNNVDRIDVLITDAVEDSDGVKKDVRHGYWNAGAWRQTDGTSLGAVPIDFTTFTPVATSGAPDSFGDVWVWDVQRRGASLIEAVFARFISATEHRYYYARWNGSAWSKVEIDAGEGMGTPDTRSSHLTDGIGSVEGYYSPGLYLDSVEEGVVYCSVGNSGYSLVYRYITLDDGVSWSRERISGMVKENIRPFVPQGRTDEYAVLWASGDYHFYDFAVTSDVSYGYTTNILVAPYAYSAAAAAPVNTAIPAISGTAQSGNVLTASTGTWTGDVPISFTYQWKRDGVDREGETSSTYTVVAGDISHTLTVTVTATNDVGSASATSSGASGIPVNLVTKSELLGSWTQNAVSTVANVAANPVNGAVTVDRVVQTAQTSSHSIACPVAISFANATVYTFSFYVDYTNWQFVQLLFGAGAFGAQAYANFDIQNGAVQTVGSTATAAIEDVGGGFYRISITATSTAAASVVAALYMVQAGNSARAESFLGSTSNNVNAFGAQVETGSTANIYAPVA